MAKRQGLPPDVRARVPALASHFHGDRRVVALYLFGSFARGNEDLLSDIDLAILLRSEIPRSERATSQGEYFARASDLLGTHEVSLVLLNDAPLPLRYEIIRTGKVLLDSDRRARLRFEVQTEDLFFDFKPMLDAYDEELLHQLAGAAGE